MSVSKTKRCKKERANFSTTLDPKIVSQAQILRAILAAKGVDKDGVNELIEEGLRIVIDKYSKEAEIELSQYI
jgi:hypothetical protein